MVPGSAGPRRAVPAGTPPTPGLRTPRCPRPVPSLASPSPLPPSLPILCPHPPSASPPFLIPDHWPSSPLPSPTLQSQPCPAAVSLTGIHPQLSTYPSRSPGPTLPQPRYRLCCLSEPASAPSPSQFSAQLLMGRGGLRWAGVGCQGRWGHHRKSNKLTVGGEALTSWFISTVDPALLGLGQFPYPMPSGRIQAGAEAQVFPHQYCGLCVLRVRAQPSTHCFVPNPKSTTVLSSLASQ